MPWLICKFTDFQDRITRFSICIFQKITVIRPKKIKGEKSLNSDICHNIVTVVTILSTIYGPRREKTSLRGL